MAPPRACAIECGLFHKGLSLETLNSKLAKSAERSSTDVIKITKLNAMGQVKWFDRKFDFAINQNIIPSIIERLEGTPIRIREKLRTTDSSLYKIKPNGEWSILENVGHLADLEPLWQGRLDDILSGQKELRPTDLDNKKTFEANHNDTPLWELLSEVEALRKMTVTKLRALDDSDVFKSALHPRLKTPMRTIDLFTFVAEHDDHHLAKITEIIGFSKAKKAQNKA